MGWTVWPSILLQGTVQGLWGATTPVSDTVRAPGVNVLKATIKAVSPACGREATAGRKGLGLRIALRAAQGPDSGRWPPGLAPFPDQLDSEGRQGFRQQGEQ